MAATAITNTVITRNASTALPATAAVAANEGALVTYDKDDQKIMLILENASATTTLTAVISKGNGLQGVKDLEVTVGTSSKVVAVIESGAYKNVSGDNKGKVLIKDKVTTATTLKVAAIVTP